jgi:signal transduction histidine kinase
MTCRVLSFCKKLVFGLSLLLVACLAGLADPANATEAEASLIRDIGLLRDPSGSMTIDTVQDKAFLPSGQLIIAGYTGAAFWVRLTILPAPRGGKTVLVVRPPTFDRITLYSADEGQPDRWVARNLGGTVPLGAEDWASSLRGFGLEPKPEGTVYYLRLETTGSFTAFIDALPEFAAHRQGLMIDFAQITYLSLMLVLMVWSLRMALLTREHLFWWFAALQAGWIFHNLFFFGYISLLAPNMPQEIVFLTYRSAVVGVSALAIAFHHTVLRRFDPHWALLRVLEVMILIMATAFVIFWIGNRTLALQINGLCIAATPFAFFATAFSAKTSASPGLRAMRVIYALLTGALLLWLLSLLGLLEVGSFPLYGTMIHGTATGGLMATILHLHAQNLLAEAQRAQAALGALQERRATEEEQKRTLMRFIDMLTHETKNAMAVINMSVSAPQMGERQKSRVAEAIRDLTSVIDRCNQSVQLDSVEQSITRVSCDPTAILREACLGHPAAERTVLIAPDTVALHSDPVLLRVIVTNLIENALKYSPAGSRVDVALTKVPEGHVEITVENDAGQTGMPDPEQVFERYYRSPRALSQIGSGLGLYLVQGLVRVLGGGIAYEPRAGRVRFRLWLPC